MDTETTPAPDQRRTLMVAIVVAAIIAAIVWYGLFGRSNNTDEATVFTPTDTELTDTEVDFPITEDSVETQAPVIAQDQTTTTTALPTPQPYVAGYSVPTDADTGAGTTILLTAIAAIGVGVIGLRRIV